MSSDLGFWKWSVGVHPSEHRNLDSGVRVSICPAP
jgi:hypothetical protein